MTFSKPITFREALQSRQVKTALPTTLSSRELSRADGAARYGLFSARVANAEFLQRFDDQVQSYIGGETDPATMRLRMKEYLQSISYHPAEGEEGTIKDLSRRRTAQSDPQDQRRAGPGLRLVGPRPGSGCARPMAVSGAGPHRDTGARAELAAALAGRRPGVWG